jgi:Zn-dependent M28 family amino/carboxypeptidase
MFFHLILLPVLFLPLAAVLLPASARAAPEAPLPAAVSLLAQTHITPGALLAPVRFLASDALEGRGPASRGDVLARLYLATELEGLGYQPGFPGGQWQQPLDVVGIKAEFPAIWSFRGQAGGFEAAWGRDYIAASGVQEPAASVQNSELVFVGYGIKAPEYQWDDFKGQKLAGKILVMLNNDPDWDPKLFAGARRLYYGRWTYKYESAARQGAAGAIIIHTTASAGYPWQVVQSSFGGEQFDLPAAGEAHVTIRAWLTEDAARRLIKAGGHDLDRLVQQARQRSFRPVPLGLTTSMAFKAQLSRSQTANVAGVLPGSDPALASQAVIFSAHHDHFGLGSPDAGGDRIYHGARDNAAGCAQVLAIARAFASLGSRPRRSILILFVAAEERNLLGSRYYAAHPTFAAGRIAADVNYDGGNIFGRTRDVALVSAGKSATLDAIAARVALSQGRVIKPDQFPDRGYYYRSDQFSFAKIGVPALYFDTGTDFIGRPVGWGREKLTAWEEHQYHQPGDKLEDDWDVSGMVEDAQLGMLAGWLIAQADGLPQWNAGDEFEAERQRALAAAQ